MSSPLLAILLRSRPILRGALQQQGIPSETATPLRHVRQAAAVPQLLPQKTRIFKVEDYGAVGDGVTDDGIAVANAVLAAAKDSSEEKIVQFKAGRLIVLPLLRPATVSSG